PPSPASIGTTAATWGPLRHQVPRSLSSPLLPASSLSAATRRPTATAASSSRFMSHLRTGCCRLEARSRIPRNPRPPDLCAPPPPLPHCSILSTPPFGRQGEGGRSPAAPPPWARAAVAGPAGAFLKKARPEPSRFAIIPSANP